MGLRRTSSFVLYSLFIFHLHHTFLSVSSRPSLVDKNHETLPLIDVSKPDVVSFEGKARELAVVIKKGGSTGRGGRGGRSRSRIMPIPGGGGGSHKSSGSRKLRGTVCAVGWLGLSVLADCKAFMQKFNEVGESEVEKEESKDASETAGLLEKLTVEETKTEEKSVEKVKTEVEAEAKKESEPEKADEEKKTEEASGPST